MRARARRMIVAGLLTVVGCGEGRELPTGERRPYGPGEAPSAMTVQLRNACPEAVVIAIAADAPGPSTPTKTLRSTAVEALTVEQGARIWLRFDGRFDESTSYAPTGDEAVEISFQCNSIYSRPGRL